MPRGSNFIDLTGQMFGRLTVTSRAPSRGDNTYWLCLCQCGKVTEALGTNLKRGGVRSCGCLAKELTSTRFTKHGKRASRAYKSWADMLGRCHNPNNSAFHYYGGRGITVCDEWKDFENFIADMGEREEGYSLERVKVDLGYYKDNCKWIPKIEQPKNRTNTVWVEVNGQAMCLADAARAVGLKVNCVRQRINRGATIEEALKPY